MKPNLHLYKLDQTGTHDYIIDILVTKGIPFQIYRDNIFGISYPDRPLFVAHMDTVGEGDVKKPLKLKNGILTRKGPYVLGADDKAGVDILLQNIEDINFCFTVDEEIGCLGATNLAKHEPFLDKLEKIPCAIEYDRKNNADLISYCGQNLIDEIETRTHYRNADGLFTDITQWEDFMPSVNLSVGYYNPHAGTEYLSVAQWEIAANTLPVLNQIRGAFDLSPVSSRYSYGYGYPRETYNWSDAPYDDDAWKDYLIKDNYNPWAEEELKICEYCGAKETLDTDFYQVDGYDVLCGKCLEFMYQIKRLK